MMLMEISRGKCMTRPCYDGLAYTCTENNLLIDYYSDDIAYDKDPLFMHLEGLYADDWIYANLAQ